MFGEYRFVQNRPSYKNIILKVGLNILVVTRLYLILTKELVL